MPPQPTPQARARQREETLSLDTGDGPESDLEGYDPRQRDEILAVTRDGENGLRAFRFDEA